MIDNDFAAYIEGLPAQDRRTVEQALVGLRSALNQVPRAEAEVEGRLRVSEMLKAVRHLAQRDAPPRAWRLGGRWAATPSH